MGFSRFFTKLPKIIENPNVSSEKTIQSILQLPMSPSLLLPNLEMGSLNSLTSSLNTPKDPIFIHNVITIVQNHFSIHPNRLRNPSILRFQFTAFRRSIHVGLDEKNPNLVTNRIAEDTEKICKIISNHSNCSFGNESSLNVSGVKVSPELVEQVLKKLTNAGALALSFFRWAENQEGFKYTTESYNALIEALGKIKQFKLIWTLVNSMKEKGLLKKETFSLIIRRYVRARKIKDAVNTFEKMEKFGLQPELLDFNRFIDALSKNGQPKTAQEVFGEMKKRRFSPDIKTYTILLEGWGQDQNMVMLKEVYRELRDEGFEPDVVTYGIIINAYCKSRKYDEAIELFREMEVKKCKPSPHIYCTLINGLGSEKRLNEALEFFEQSKSSGFIPEIPTYNAVVGSYCSSMRLHDAYRVVKEMRECGVGPNSRTYDIILHHLIKARRTKEAYSVFQRMGSEFGCEPSLSTYTIIVRMFCNEERVDMALKVWDEMKANGVPPSMHMFSSLINSLCNDNRLDEACKYFEDMLGVGIRPPGQLYSNLKQALLDAGKKDLAVSLGLKLDKIRRTSMVG